MNSSSAFAMVAEASRRELARKRRQGLLKCSDCPLFEPLAPLGAGYEGWGLCLAHGVDGAATERCCSGACAAFIAEVDADV